MISLCLEIARIFCTYVYVKITTNKAVRSAYRVEDFLITFNKLFEVSIRGAIHTAYDYIFGGVNFFFINSNEQTFNMFGGIGKVF